MDTFLNILSQISLLVDAGLVVLIWMVQLIIYPSFLYYKSENLIAWHQKYSSRIAIIVVPLMIFQLLYGLMISFYYPVTNHFIYIGIVIFLWAFTFLGFAPLHFKISDGNVNNKLLITLIHRNWVRTLFWSFLLIFHFFIF
jgi:uncharacterized membrane protein